MSAWIWLAVALLGGVGALARYALTAAIAARARSEFPYGTLAVNASAALALGLLSGLALSGTALLLAGSAALGSYSTFSTWLFETHRLGLEAEVRAAAANVLVSLAVGVAAAALGWTIGGQL